MDRISRARPRSWTITASTPAGDQLADRGFDVGQLAREDQRVERDVTLHPAAVEQGHRSRPARPRRNWWPGSARCAAGGRNRRRRPRSRRPPGDRSDPPPAQGVRASTRDPAPVITDSAGLGLIFVQGSTHSPWNCATDAILVARPGPRAWNSSVSRRPGRPLSGSAANPRDHRGRELADFANVLRQAIQTTCRASRGIASVQYCFTIMGLLECVTRSA